jgi:hypothetical protein
MQAAVSICIIGPIADKNGEVEVRRYVSYIFGIRDSLSILSPASMLTGQEVPKVQRGPYTIRLVIPRQRNRWLRMVERILVRNCVNHICVY